MQTRYWLHHTAPSENYLGGVAHTLSVLRKLNKQKKEGLSLADFVTCPIGKTEPFLEFGIQYQYGRKRVNKFLVCLAGPDSNSCVLDRCR
jgi:hypothetical protein